MKDHILTVPFYSQYLDIKDPHWMIRGCGIICLKMAFDYYGLKTPDNDTLIKEGVAMGAHGPSGWYHNGLVAIGEKYGLKAHREEDMNPEIDVGKIAESIHNNTLVIASVPHVILGRKKFHMILVVGFKLGIDDTLAGFYYHDPASDNRESGKAQYSDLETFKKEWRRMAIFLQK
jgi:hypothetical protein